MDVRLLKKSRYFQQKDRETPAGFSTVWRSASLSLFIRKQELREMLQRWKSFDGASDLSPLEVVEVGESAAVSAFAAVPDEEVHPLVEGDASSREQVMRQLGEYTFAADLARCFGDARSPHPAVAHGDPVRAPKAFRVCVKLCAHTECEESVEIFGVFHDLMTSGGELIRNPDLELAAQTASTAWARRKEWQSP